MLETIIVIAIVLTAAVWFIRWLSKDTNRCGSCDTCGKKCSVGLFGKDKNDKAHPQKNT